MGYYKEIAISMSNDSSLTQAEAEANIRIEANEAQNNPGYFVFISSWDVYDLEEYDEA